MHVHFTDVHGCDGWIDDDLSLSYYGKATITESIDTHLDELGADGGATESNLESLVLDLPRECSVRDVELVYDDS